MILDGYFNGTKAECDEINRKIKIKLDIPNEKTNTREYSIPRPHHTRPDVWIIRIGPSLFNEKMKKRLPLDDIEKVLTAREREIATLGSMRSEGAFKTDDQL